MVHSGRGLLEDPDVLRMALWGKTKGSFCLVLYQYERNLTDSLIAAQLFWSQTSVLKGLSLPFLSSTFGFSS